MADNETPPSEAARTAYVTVDGGEPSPPEQTPQSIADVFREAVRATGQEEGIELIPQTPKRGRAARTAEGAPPVADVAPNWTGDGIGRVVASGHDMVFKSFDLPELEPDERKDVETQTARFLNAVWPTGATYEPHAAFLLTEASVIIPRVAAYQMRRKEEAEREAAKKAGHIGPTLLSDKSDKSEDA